MSGTCLFLLASKGRRAPPLGSSAAAALLCAAVPSALFQQIPWIRRRQASQQPKAVEARHRSKTESNRRQTHRRPMPTIRRPTPTIPNQGRSRRFPSDQRQSTGYFERTGTSSKNRWRDGTTHVAFDPVDFVAKLAALVPPPRSHLVRYHGVLAPAARLRSRIVPAGPAPAAGLADPIILDTYLGGLRGVIEETGWDDRGRGPGCRSGARA